MRTGTDPSTDPSPQKSAWPMALSSPSPGSQDCSRARYSSSFSRRITRRRLSLSMPPTLISAASTCSRIQLQAALPVGAAPQRYAYAAAV
eukprot:3236715-Heterocapsa_arctica.AAC.1